MRFTLTLDAEVWQYDEPGGWHFLTVPVSQAEELRGEAGPLRRGFGSLRVSATIGETTWATSVFPVKDGSFLLPIKKQVRRAEDLLAGDTVTVTLVLADDPRASGRR